MTRPNNRIRRFFSEIWRRHVLQIAIPYGVIGWLVVQVLELVTDVYEAPAWIMQAVLATLVAGFPIAIVLAWVFDWSPKGGLQMTRPMAEPAPGAPAADGDDDSGTDTDRGFLPAPALALEMGDSERRQVTVLHARLTPVRTDALQDPEFMQVALRSIEHLFADLEARFEARRLPAGPLELVLVFGYPVTRQGEARNAVAAGLTLAAELRKAPELDDTAGATAFEACMGVATGLVVAEDRDGSGQIQFIGLAPRIAAWLMGQAEAGTLLIDPRTRKLAGHHYRVSSLGQFEAAEFGGQSEVWLVTEAVGNDLKAADQAPLFGRDEELAQLGGCWDSVLEGDGRYVLVRGDGGLGKSSLLRAFVRRVYDARFEVYHGQCQHQDRHTPFAPVITIIRDQVLNLAESDNDQQRRQRIDKFVTRNGMPREPSVALMSRLLGLDAGGGLDFAGDSPQSIRARTIDLVLDMLTTIARRNPVLMALEDLPWADPSTLELVGQLMNRGPIPGLCLVFTSRPEFEADWMRRSFVQTIDLRPLPRRRARTLIEQVAGGAVLPEDLCDRIIDETGGNPLHLQELTRAVLESSQWRAGIAGDGRLDLAQLSIPANLQESITARIDNLGNAKSVLQLCSVLGREFSWDLLRDASGTENEAALGEALARIVEAELLFQSGMGSRRNYLFKHVFIQEAAYETMLRSKRRQLHARVAEVIEKRVTETGRQQALLLAHHYTEAGDVENAIPNWIRVSGESLQAFANREAAEQARRGIALLETQPPSPARTAMAVPLQTTLGTALLAQFGYAHEEVREAYGKALALSEELGDNPDLFRALVGVWMYWFVAGEYQEALRLGRRMLGIAEASGHPAQSMQARYCVGLVLFYLGELAESRQQFQAALDAEQADCDYASQSPTGDDNRIHVRAHLGLVEWQMGAARSALQRMIEARELAAGLQHPVGQLFAHFLGAWLQQMRGDAAATAAWAGQGARIAADKGFPFWEALCGYMLSWSAASDSGRDGAQRATDLAQMQQCLALYSMTGSRAGLSWLQLRVASVALELGQADTARDMLVHARDTVQANGEVVFEPEILRLEANLARLQGAAPADTSAMLEDAIARATAMGAHAQALAAALDLAATDAGAPDPAGRHRLLDEVLSAFGETDESCYFVRARGVLEAT